MSRSIFTPEELEELRQADAEIEAGFVMTHEERVEINRREKKSRDLSPETRARNIERSKAYYREHREAVLAQQKERYRERREEMCAVRREYQRTYYATHREEILARKRAQRAAAKSMIKQEGEGKPWR